MKIGNSTFVGDFRSKRLAPLAFGLAALFIVAQLNVLSPTVEASSAGPVVFWNQFTTTLGLAHKLQAPFFARAYALVQVAEWDALFLTVNKNDGNPSQAAIVAGAASEMLAYLFPSDGALISTTEGYQLAASKDPQIS